MALVGDAGCGERARELKAIWRIFCVEIVQYVVTVDGQTSSSAHVRRTDPYSLKESGIQKSIHSVTLPSRHTAH